MNEPNRLNPMPPMQTQGAANVPLRWLTTSVQRTLAGLRRATRFLVWLAVPLMKTVELLTVLGVFSVAVYGGYWLVFGSATSPQHYRVQTVVQTVNDNWKAFLLLGVPLFYRPIRQFVDEMEKGPMGTQRRQVSADLLRQEENPSTEGKS